VSSDSSFLFWCWWRRSCLSGWWRWGNLTFSSRWWWGRSLSLSWWRWGNLWSSGADGWLWWGYSLWCLLSCRWGSLWSLFLSILWGCLWVNNLCSSSRLLVTCLLVTSLGLSWLFGISGSSSSSLYFVNSLFSLLVSSWIQNSIFWEDFSNNTSSNSLSTLSQGESDSLGDG